MKLILGAFLMTCLCGCSTVQSAVESDIEANAEFNLSEIGGSAGNENTVSLATVRQLNIHSDARIYLMQGDEPSLNILRKASPEADIEILQHKDQLDIIDDSEQKQTLDIFLTPRALASINAEGHTLTVFVENNGNIQLGHLVAEKVCLRMEGHGRMTVVSVASEEAKIKLNGHGHIEVADIAATSLDVLMVGHGGVTLAGSVDQQHVKIKGHGHYSAPELQTQLASIDIQGKAMASLSVASQPSVIQGDMANLKVRQLDHAKGNVRLASIPTSPFYRGLSATAHISL